MSSAFAVLACALAVLGRTPSDMPVELVDVAPPATSVSTQVEAFVRPYGRTIYLVTSSPVFRDALRTVRRCDDQDVMKKLASILAHEEWHLLHGSDERGAYEAQLTTLLRLGVRPGSPIHINVVRSMLAVLEAHEERTAILAARR